MTAHEAPITPVFVKQSSELPAYRYRNPEGGRPAGGGAKTLTDVTGADVTARSEGKSRPDAESQVSGRESGPGPGRCEPGRGEFAG